MVIMVMVMVMVNLTRLLQVLLKRRECVLSVRKISRLKSLSQGAEILVDGVVAVRLRTRHVL